MAMIRVVAPIDGYLPSLPSRIFKQYLTSDVRALSPEGSTSITKRINDRITASAPTHFTAPSTVHPHVVALMTPVPLRRSVSFTTMRMCYADGTIPQAWYTHRHWWPTWLKPCALAGIPQICRPMALLATEACIFVDDISTRLF
jgi:hypothetical protein